MKTKGLAIVTLGPGARRSLPGRFRAHLDPPQGVFTVFANFGFNYADLRALPINAVCPTSGDGTPCPIVGDLAPSVSPSAVENALYGRSSLRLFR